MRHISWPQLYINPLKIIARPPAVQRRIGEICQLFILCWLVDESKPRSTEINLCSIHLCLHGTPIDRIQKLELEKIL